MKDKQSILLAAIICLIIVIDMGCEKKEENENPTIQFLQPDGNLIITNDTVISFIAEPFDKDGTIERVEFSIDGILVQTVINSPYKFDWSITTEDNIGIKLIKVTAYDNTGAKAEAELQIEIKSYLTKWVGSYVGTSHHWSSSPCEIDGQWQMCINHSYEDVEVNVNMGSQDSCLNFGITYNDSIIETKEDLIFSTLGNHFSQWGGGSGYGYLNISFETDSLHYKYFQNCGIPCSSGIDFVLVRTE